MSKSVCVGMGELAISSDPETELICLGLGSCIAVCAYHKRRKWGLMAHVVLPSSSGRDQTAKAKYADSAIPLIAEEIARAGYIREEIQVVLCGGAAIFPSLQGVMDIGQRNITAVKAELQRARLRVVKEEVGGRESRTLTLEIASGNVRLRTVRTGEYSLTSLGG
ncbi:MAG: chemotaxis protein CheD [Armatimonadota bacterium]